MAPAAARWIVRWTPRLAAAFDAPIRGGKVRFVQGSHHRDCRQGADVVSATMASSAGCASTSRCNPTLASSMSITSPSLALALMGMRNVSRKSRNAVVVSLRLFLWCSQRTSPQPAAFAMTAF